MTSTHSIIEILASHARLNPERTAFSYLEFIDGDEATETNLTYGALDKKARDLAAVFQKHVGLGNTAILLYPSGLDYITAFFGCLYAGVVAVPAYPPFTSAVHRRLQAIVADSRARCILTNGAILDGLKSSLDIDSEYGDVEWLSTDTMALDDVGPLEAFDIGEGVTAFLQYTSGSTADPKGVCLTHGNLLHNLGLIQQSFETTSETKGVFWLPLYHDMGLIGGLLHTVYVGVSTAVFSPMDFLRQPFRWLKVISDRRVAVSGGPNFAYDHCVQKVTDEQLAQLDLSCWQVAANGAEPIRYGTLFQFATKFAPAGFREEAFFPCYGLAESTLMVSGARKKARPTVRLFNNAALRRNKVIIEDDDPHGLVRVGCGPVVGDTRVAIVDPDTGRRCPEDTVGEVWVKSSSVAHGYYNRDKETAEVFRAFIADDGDGPYLRTGDIGFLFDGELFISGRIKDLVIIRGKNYYPSDIEKIIEVNTTSKYTGTAAIFSIEEDGVEKLVVLQEIKRGASEKERAEIVKTIKKNVMIKFKLKFHEIVLVRAGSVLKTSSGKIRRNANRKSYLGGTLERV